MREAQEMTQHLRLVQFGKSRQIVATEIGAENFRAALLTSLAWRQIDGEPSRRREFENQGNLAFGFLLSGWIVMFGHCNDFGNDSDLARRRHHLASANTSRRRA